MDEDQRQDREQRAEQYEARSGCQSDWYNRKAEENKQLFHALGIAIIILGAVVVVVPIIFGGTSISISDKVVAVVGALIVITKGVERTWLPEEKWISYRKASEALLREREKYVEGVEPYNRTIKEDQIYRLFVERCILIKAEEQNNFWGINEGQDNPDT